MIDFKIHLLHLSPLKMEQVEIVANRRRHRFRQELEWLKLHFEFHRVCGNDLDVAGNESWSFGTGGYAVPWVRAELLRSVFHRGTMIGVLRDKIKELAVDFRRQELIPRQK